MIKNFKYSVGDIVAYKHNKQKLRILECIIDKNNYTSYKTDYVDSSPMMITPYIDAILFEKWTVNISRDKKLKRILDDIE